MTAGTRSPSTFSVIVDGAERPISLTAYRLISDLERDRVAVLHARSVIQGTDAEIRALEQRKAEEEATLAALEQEYQAKRSLVAQRTSISRDALEQIFERKLLNLHTASAGLSPT